jgi:calreticulin
MFGPDMCGYDVSRIHAILNFEGENLLKTEDVKLDYSDKNEFTHLYTLVLKADKTYAVYFDQVEKASGNIVDDWGFPPKEVDDPASTKPGDWVDEKKIPDVTDVKPEGHDDIPEEIPDPDAAKPEDWDDEDDGEWEAPTIDNPEYEGPWVQKMIENPEYSGEWAPAKIANDKYTEDIANYENLGTAGFELWIVNEGSVFDNIFVGDNYEEAKAFADETWGKTKVAEKEAKEAFDAAKKAVEDAKKAEEDAKKAEEDAAAAEDEPEEEEAEEEETHDEL